MSLRFFVGPAGSGKTIGLIDELVAVIENNPLDEHERVLALTKMHGSRRRMQDRFFTVPGLRGRFECVTMDSFAWRVLRRWRSLDNIRFGEKPAVEDYDEVCRRAGVLVANAHVRTWIARAFPVVIVDEIQDSKDGQLEVIKALADTLICLAAGDEFQDLDGSIANAAVEWAGEYGEVVPLASIHRTDAVGLLSAASALREGRSVPKNGGGFAVLGARNSNTGAGYVSRNLTWWSGCNDIAVLTPVRAERSDFIRNLIERVGLKPIGNPPVGPHRIPWEESQEDEQGRFLAQLALPNDLQAEVHASDVSLPEAEGPSKAINSWLVRQRNLAGRTVFTVAEIENQVRVIHQRSRAYRRTGSMGVRAMTIHQAKNREFDSVIVLWPYEVTGSSERLRRLLYNAITRAKRQAIVVVQNPERLNNPPFVREAD